MLTISRRSFISSAAAILPAVRLAQRRRGAASLDIGVETWSFHDVDLETMLRHVHDLGVDHLELHDGHLPRTATPAHTAATTQRREMRHVVLC